MEEQRLEENNPFTREEWDVLIAAAEAFPEGWGMSWWGQDQQDTFYP